MIEKFINEIKINRGNIKENLKANNGELLREVLGCLAKYIANKHYGYYYNFDKYIENGDTWTMSKYSYKTALAAVECIGDFYGKFKQEGIMGYHQNVRLGDYSLWMNKHYQMLGNSSQKLTVGYTLRTTDERSEYEKELLEKALKVLASNSKVDLRPESEMIFDGISDCEDNLKNLNQTTEEFFRDASVFNSEYEDDFSVIYCDVSKIKKAKIEAKPDPVDFVERTEEELIKEEFEMLDKQIDELSKKALDFIDDGDSENYKETHRKLLALERVVKKMQTLHPKVKHNF